MNRQQYEEQQKRRCKDEWFKEHLARSIKMRETVGPVTGVEMIDWRNPQSSNYWMRYILSGRFLIVIGDAGDAVFEWGENITLDFLNGCDLHYFAEKCRASEQGSRFTYWNTNVLHDTGDSLLVEWGYSEEVREAFIEAADNMQRDEFMLWLWHDAPKELRQDSDQCSALMDCGDTLHPRLIGMWVGLKMAHEQLQGASGG